MLLRMLNGISFFPRVITKATSLFKSTTPGQGSWILLLPTALSLPPPTPNHQPAPNVCIYLCIRAYEFLHNIIGDHPVPSTLIIIVPSSLCISDNSCIYLRSQPCIPFSSSRNCINALPYSKSLVANIYSEGLLLLPIPSLPPSSLYGVTSSTLHMIRILSLEGSDPSLLNHRSVQ